MIAVVGSAFGRRTTAGIEADGLAAAIARATTASGGPVQLVGKVGEGPDGDAVLLSLAAAGVGHVAVLRDVAPAHVETESHSAEADVESADQLAAHDDEYKPSRPVTADTETQHSPTLDAADLELALRYLPDYDVVVIAERLDSDAVAAVVEAARWAGAKLVSTFAAEGLPEDATVFEAPDENPEGAFATVVGRYAAALDRGEDPREAFTAAAAGLGWSPVATD
jgi:hypothetical protein